MKAIIQSKIVMAFSLAVLSIFHRLSCRTVITATEG
jgi:hypothetical protein